MKKLLILGLCFAGIVMAQAAKADSGADYTEGYNAGYENVAPPGYDSSEDYVYGWRAGREAEQAKAAEENAPAEPAMEPQSDGSSDSSE